jgi:isopenicillin-N N-acyltransferase like protein
MQPVAFTSSPLPPYERGLEFGERFAAEVSRTAAAYRRLFARRADRPFDVDDWSERAWAAIGELSPQHAEELRGIAVGAGRPVREVAAVNARTELLVAANPSGTTECSSVVSLPPGLPPVVVQTWDWYDAMADGWLHWTIPYPDGRRVETVTEFGMLAKIGVNGHGVAVMLNMLHHENDAKAAAEGAVGFPVHLLSRSVLEDAADVAGATAIASRPAVSASTALTFADASGAAVGVELFPGGPGLIEPVDDLLVRTNHFVSDAGTPGCLADTISVSTRLRRDVLLAAFADGPPATAEAVLAGMRHHHPDGGVCSHVDERTERELWHRTLATVTIDVASGSLDVMAGGPCRADAAPAA